MEIHDKYQQFIRHVSKAERWKQREVERDDNIFVKTNKSKKFAFLKQHNVLIRGIC